MLFRCSYNGIKLSDFSGMWLGEPLDNELLLLGIVEPCAFFFRMEGILLNMAFKDLSIFLHTVEKTFVLMTNIKIYTFTNSSVTTVTNCYCIRTLNSSSDNR